MAFLLIYFLLAYYVAYNGWIWLKSTLSFTYKKSYYFTMFFVSISFFIGQFLDFQLFNWIGYVWLIFFGYGLLIFPILNLIYFLNKKRGLKWFGFGIIAFYLFVFTYGSYNMWNPVVVSYDVEIQKESEMDDLKILLISDIHISETIGNRFINRLINLSNQVEPDLIFLAGDVLDNSIDPYLKHNIGETLAGLAAPLGVYAVLGNHEYYGNDIPIFIEEMNQIDVEVLIDEVFNYNDLFYIVGRKDYSDQERQDIALLTSNLEKTKPIFLIDHQPREFDEISAAGVDLMVSGHTHKGQVFPGNLITNAIYENHYGLLTKDTLHTIVSSGYGIWGPPFRIGSRSEVVEIHVKFTN
uniref:Calcineurin-like phosphoesterase domain-containing protein n=1 Tax=Anaerobacillus isosaccharinicus TaxID=1532552 RepID=A0A1S2L192_9BACI